MKTYIATFVANIELVLSILMSVVLIIMGINNDTVVAELDGTAMAVVYMIIFLIIMSAVMSRLKSFVASLVTFLLFLIILEYGPSAGKIENQDIAWWLYQAEELLFGSWTTGWALLVIGCVAGAVMAFYAFRNYSEVVSRRMLWRNSRVSLLESQYAYSVNRFCATASSVILSYSSVHLFLTLFSMP